MPLSSRRVIRCEEWKKLQIGGGAAVLSRSDAESIFATWRASTGTDPSKYFDVGVTYLAPKFWSGTLHCSGFVLEVMPIGSLQLLPEQRKCLDSSLSLMLGAVTGRVSVQSTEGELSSGGSRVDTLLVAFCKCFRLARRVRVIRSYAVESRAGRTFTGRLSFPRQALLDIAAPGNFASHALKLTEDTSENRLIAAVLRRYRSKCSPSTRRLIDACLGELDGITEPVDIGHEWNKIRFDRLPDEYKVVLQQARALLDGNFAGVFEGDVVATAEIIFTSRLFEKFVAMEFEAIASRLGHKVESQNRGIFLCRNGSGKRAFELIPDLVIRGNNGSVLAVADTKWKRVDSKRAGFGIAPEDIYQSLTYAAYFGCSNVALLFPNITEHARGKLVLGTLSTTLQGKDYSIDVIGLPMLSDIRQGCREAIERLLLNLNKPAMSVGAELSLEVGA